MSSFSLARMVCRAAVLAAAAPALAGQPAVLINRTAVAWQVEPAMPVQVKDPLRLAAIDPKTRLRTGEGLTVRSGAPARGPGAPRFVVAPGQGLRMTLDHPEGRYDIPFWVSCEQPGTSEPFGFILRFRSDLTQDEPVSALQCVAEWPALVDPPFRLESVWLHEAELLPAGSGAPAETKAKARTGSSACTIL